MVITLEKLIRTRVPKPRELPKRGSGGLHGEQQYCYREGVAALRKAQREVINKVEEIA